MAIPRFTQLMVPLLPLKLTEQSWHGLTHVLAVKVRPLIVVIPRFIQRVVPLLPLKPMDQSQHGVSFVM
ncbi:hypothetical protein [uncultured Gammaproteobacteria bacterium]|nr:hypothetical protein [uncultured Gammaproteobacteria bacterium]